MSFKTVKTVKADEFHKLINNHIEKMRATGHDLITIKMADDFTVTVVKYPCFHTMRIAYYDNVHEYVVNMRPDFLGRLELYIQPFYDVTNENAYQNRDCIKCATSYIYAYYYNSTGECLPYELSDFKKAVHFISYPVNRTKAALRTQEY